MPIPGSAVAGGLSKDLLASLGKRPSEKGWPRKQEGLTRSEVAVNWALAERYDEIWVIDYESYAWRDVERLASLLEGSGCALYLTSMDENLPQYEAAPRCSIREDPRSAEAAQWHQDFTSARHSIHLTDGGMLPDWVDRSMTQAYESTIAILPPFWDATNSSGRDPRAQAITALIADTDPQRQVLRAVGAQSALLQHGFVAQISGDPYAELEEVDDPTITDEVRRAYYPRHYLGPLLGRVPIPPRVIRRVPLAAIGMRDESVELLGYRFAGGAAVALRAGLQRFDNCPTPFDLPFHGLSIYGNPEQRFPSSTGGMDITITDLGALGDDDHEPFLHRCAIIHQLSRFGWNKVVRVRDTPSRRTAVQGLLADGLVDEVDHLQVTSTRALRFSQFSGHELGEVRSGRRQRASSANSRIAPAFLLRP